MDRAREEALLELMASRGTAAVVSLLSDDVDFDGWARHETEQAGRIERSAKSAASVANPRDAEGFRVCVNGVRLPEPSSAVSGSGPPYDTRFVVT